MTSKDVCNVFKIAFLCYSDLADNETEYRTTPYISLMVLVIWYQLSLSMLYLHKCNASLLKAAYDEHLTFSEWINGQTSNMAMGWQKGRVCAHMHSIRHPLVHL